MTYWLLWNPKEDPRTFKKEIERLGQGLPTFLKWRRGTRSSYLIGDRVFFLKSGKPRVIFGSAFVSSIEDITAGTIQVQLDKAVDPFGNLVLSEEEFRPFYGDAAARWNPQSSGNSIPAKVADRIESLWKAKYDTSISSTSSRNPKWHRDEIILALELYFDKSRGAISASNPKVIELSELLNKLPLFSFRPDAVKFRNPNGVALKLANFLHFDRSYRGQGMKGGSALDKQIFFEFKENRPKLSKIAKLIKDITADSALVADVSQIIDEEDGFAMEGQIIYKLHRLRERDASLAKNKKNFALRKHGRLACEVCEFDFQHTFGDLGHGFIECHHTTPLSSLTKEKKTSLNDLALVCSNCHRMLHRSKVYLSVDRLRDIRRNE